MTPQVRGPQRFRGSAAASLHVLDHRIRTGCVQPGCAWPNHILPNNVHAGMGLIEVVEQRVVPAPQRFETANTVAKLALEHLQMVVDFNDAITKLLGAVRGGLFITAMRANLGRLDELLDEAGELIISRRGKPIARVLPMSQHRQRPSHSDLRERIAKLSKPSANATRAERDER